MFLMKRFIAHNDLLWSHPRRTKKHKVSRCVSFQSVQEVRFVLLSLIRSVVDNADRRPSALLVNAMYVGCMSGRNATDNIYEIRRLTVRVEYRGLTGS